MEKISYKTSLKFLDKILVGGILLILFAECSVPGKQG